MAIYVPLSPVPLQFVDSNGDVQASATLSFYLSGTSTPTNLFSDSSGTSIGTSITLNAEGYPESGGNVITLFRDTSIDYKIVMDDGSTVWTSDTLNSELDVLASTANGEGASLIGVEDSAGDITATTVEGALAEIVERFEVVTTTNVITAAESPKTFFLNTAGGFTSTLPAPAAGLRFKFIVSTAPTTAYIIATNGGSNVLYGAISESSDTTGTSVQAQDTLNFVASTSLIGDWAEFVSDGTNWYVQATTQANGGITVSVT